MIPGYVPPAAEMSADNIEKAKMAELLKKVSVLRDTVSRRNDAEVEGPPDMSFCWVFDDPRMISQYEGMGYSLVTKSNGGEVKGRFRRSDGTHKRQDSVLMQIPKDMKEAWETDAAMRAVDQVRGAKSQFSEFAAESRIPMFQKQ